MKMAPPFSFCVHASRKGIMCFCDISLSTLALWCIQDPDTTPATRFSSQPRHRACSPGDRYLPRRSPVETGSSLVRVDYGIPVWHPVSGFVAPTHPSRMNVAAPEGRPGGDSVTVHHPIKELSFLLTHSRQRGCLKQRALRHYPG